MGEMLTYIFSSLRSSEKRLDQALRIRKLEKEIEELKRPEGE